MLVDRHLGAGVSSQHLKTVSMCVRSISVYPVYLVLYRAACWNVVLFNLFKIACQQRIFGLFSSRSADQGAVIIEAF